MAQRSRAETRSAPSARCAQPAPAPAVPRRNATPREAAAFLRMSSMSTESRRLFSRLQARAILMTRPSSLNLTVRSTRVLTLGSKMKLILKQTHRTRAANLAAAKRRGRREVRRRREGTAMSRSHCSTNTEHFPLCRRIVDRLF
jgi:hypothetical protein